MERRRLRRIDGAIAAMTTTTTTTTTIWRQRTSFASSFASSFLVIALALLAARDLVAHVNANDVARSTIGNAMTTTTTSSRHPSLVASRRRRRRRRRRIASFALSSARFAATGGVEAAAEVLNDDVVVVGSLFIVGIHRGGGGDEDDEIGDDIKDAKKHGDGTDDDGRHIGRGAPGRRRKRKRKRTRGAADGGGGGSGEASLESRNENGASAHDDRDIAMTGNDTTSTTIGKRKRRKRRSDESAPSATRNNPSHPVVVVDDDDGAADGRVLSSDEEGRVIIDDGSSADTTTISNMSTNKTTEDSRWGTNRRRKRRRMPRCDSHDGDAISTTTFAVDVIASPGGKGGIVGSTYAMDGEDVVDARTIDDDVRLNGEGTPHSGGFVNPDGVCENSSSSGIAMGHERGVGMRRGTRRRRSSTMPTTTVTTTTSFDAHRDDELAGRKGERGDGDEVRDAEVMDRSESTTPSYIEGTTSVSSATADVAIDSTQTSQGGWTMPGANVNSVFAEKAHRESDLREIPNAVCDEEERGENREEDEEEDEEETEEIVCDLVDTVESNDSTTSSLRLVKDFAINSDYGFATSGTNDDCKGTTPWNTPQINAVAISSDSAQPLRRGEDSFVSFGELVIPIDTEKDVARNLVFSHANVREDEGSYDQKEDGTEDVVDDERLPVTNCLPPKTEGVTTKSSTEEASFVTKSSTKEASDIDDEILAEINGTENDDQNVPPDADAAVKNSADANMNKSDVTDEFSLTDNTIEQIERIHPVNTVAGVLSKQDRGSLGKENVEDDFITLSIVTWNLGEAEPSDKDASFFRHLRKSDLIMIGAQECEEIKPRRTEGRRSRHLRRTSIAMLGEEYVPLAIHSLGGIQCAIFCHRNFLQNVETIDLADVACGVGGVFHNKGAIGVYLKLRLRGSTDNLTKTCRILLVTGHLAAHVKNVDARNSDYKRIVSELESRAPARFLRPKKADDSPVECDGAHLLSSMDHVFFAGDLNYRIDLPREYVERCIIDVQQSRSNSAHGRVDNLMKNLLCRDQLLQTIASGKAFSDFNEGKITFLPTFKFDKGTSNYDTSYKRRVPAWTDRIVFRSNMVSVLEYDAAAQAKHSDHRPVFGIFKLGWGGIGDSVSRKLKKGKRDRSRT